MHVASKLRALPPLSLASIAFFGVAGILFLVLMFISGFPPHIAILGVASIVAAYGLFAKRKWAAWLVGALLVIGSTFAVYTLAYVIAVDALTSAALIVYLALTWVFTIIVIKARKYD